MKNHTLLGPRLPRTRSTSDDGSPKYRRVYEGLRSKIMSGEFSPGEQLPIEARLCARYHASRGTVRHAMGLLVQEGLLHRISGQGTFVSDPTHLRREFIGSKQLFALVASQLHQHFFIQCIRGIKRFLRDSGYEIIVETSDNDCIREGEVLKRLADKVDGTIVILTENGQDHDHILRLKEAGKQVVLLYRDLPDADIDYVGFDFFRGAIRLMDHLVGHGHRDICHVTTTHEYLSPVRDKLRGYRAGLRRHGIPYREEYVIRADICMDAEEQDPNSIEKYCKPVVEGILNLEPKPTAVLTLNHKLAYWLGRYMMERGIRVPEDMAIVSFGDDEYLPHPPFALTMMRHHIRLVGERAARRLLELVADPHSLPERILIGDELVVRDSCGPH